MSGEFGDDPTRFADAASRRAYAETASIARASGKARVVLVRRAQSGTGRRLPLVGLSANPTLASRAYYQQRRVVGDGHGAALRRLADKLLGLLRHCLIHRVFYDEIKPETQPNRRPNTSPDQGRCPDHPCRLIVANNGSTAGGSRKLRCWVVLGLAVADGVGGGPVEGPVSAVVEFDGDRVFGDVDGQFAMGVGASESDFLSDDHDDATVGGAAVHGDWLHRGAGWGPGRAGAAECAGLVVGQRVKASAQQLSGVGVKEHQRGFLDADAHPSAGEDFGGEQLAVAQGDDAAAGDNAARCRRRVGVAVAGRLGAHRWRPARPGQWRSGGNGRS